MQRKTKAEKKGIERLGVGLARLADGQQTFWWSLNVVCNKSHRRLRACWRLGSNVITERRWVSHFSSHINFFYMLDCSSIDEPGSLRSPSKDRALPASDWLVFPTSIPKLCLCVNQKRLKPVFADLSYRSKLQKKKSLFSCIVLLLPVVSRLLVVQAICWAKHRWSKRAWSNTYRRPFVMPQRVERSSIKVKDKATAGRMETRII